MVRAQVEYSEFKKKRGIKHLISDEQFLINSKILFDESHEKMII